MDTPLGTWNVFHDFPSGKVAACEDVFNGNPAGAVIDMTQYGMATWLIVKNAGAVGTATPTVESCDDATPTTTTAVAYKYRSMTTNNVWGDITDATSAGFLIAAGADEVHMVSVRSTGLSGTDGFVRLQLTETDSTAVDGMVICILTEPRHADPTPIAAT